MRLSLVTAAVIFFLADRCFAYKIDCNGQFTATPITSVFAEARKTNCGPGASCVPDRFHSGIDITGQCSSNAQVRAVEAGKVQLGSLSCEDASACIRIVNSTAAHAFEYDHVIPVVSSGDEVTAGQLIGNIDTSSAGRHLHFVDLIRIGTKYLRVNPQLQGRLEYSDSDRPEFSTATIGAIVDKEIIPIKGGTQAAPQTFEFRDFRYYVRADVSVVATARNGSVRKGVYRVGSNAMPIMIPPLPVEFPGDRNLEFGLLQDQGADPNDVQTVYFKRQGHADSYIPSNAFTGPADQQAEERSWVTSRAREGQYNLCVIIQDHPPQPSFNTANKCIGIWIDNAAPTFTMTNAGGTVANQGATSTTTITINASDSGGIYSIGLSGPSHSSTTYLTGVQTAPSISFPIGGGTLSDGSYSVSVQDLSGNASDAAFLVDTVPPSTPNPQNPSGEELSSTFASTNSVVSPGYDADSGICKVIVTGPTSSSTFTFRGTPGTSFAGPVTVSSGNLNITYVDCAGNRSATNSTVTAGTIGMQICANGGGFTNECAIVQTPNINNAMIANGTLTLTLKSKAVGGCNGSNIAAMCALMVPNCNVITSCHCTDQATIVCSAGGLGGTASIENSSINTSLQGLQASLDLTSAYGNAGVGVQKDSTGGYSLASGASVDLSFSLADAGQRTPITNAQSGFSFLSYIKNLLIQIVTLAANLQQSARNLVLAPVGTPSKIYGSEFLFASTTTVNISTGLPAGIAIDTTTLAIYSYDGSAWSSAPVTNQVLSINGNTVTATGTIQGSGTYGLFFIGIDTTAPLSSLSVQGSSFTFDQALFVSTDAFIVLGGTDPLVNGFASTVASVTYRLDPSSGSPFSIYSSSIPLPLGTHVLEYRSLDYAGNIEAVKTATFTVTAGAAMRGSGTARVPGVLLNGFLGSGARLEVESQAQNSLTLLISSVNRQGMVAVDNIGEVGIGVTPQANLNIGQGAIGLQLRSGNSTSAVTSNQIAFAYDGDHSMRHLLRTEHSTAAHGNKLDFLVWNTGAGSTTTLASLNVLSLQGIASASGGSFHVQPVGEPDAEVEVSNGLSTGGGTMQRLQLVSPSSRRFKTDIKELNEKDEDQALTDIDGLKHANFSYKSKNGTLDPTRRTGLIYEEAPQSIRDGDDALSTTERLVNVELALKAEMRRLEELQKRYEKLKRRTP